MIDILTGVCQTETAEHWTTSITLCISLSVKRRRKRTSGGRGVYWIDDRLTRSIPSTFFASVDGTSKIVADFSRTVLWAQSRVILP